MYIFQVQDSEFCEDVHLCHKIRIENVTGFLTCVPGEYWHSSLSIQNPFAYNVHVNFAFISTDSSQEKEILQAFVVAKDEGSMIIFSNSSISSMGILAFKEVQT